VGQTDYRFSLKDLELNHALEAQIEVASDSVWKETLVDFALNTQFRADIYINKGERLNDSERTAALKATRVTLLLESNLFSEQIMRDWGVSGAAAERLLKVADSAQNITLENLHDAVCGELTWTRFLTVMRNSLLISRFALARQEGFDFQPSRRFNAHVMKAQPYGAYYPHTCCPAIGTALELPHRLLLVSEAWEEGVREPDNLIQASIMRLKERSQQLSSTTPDDELTHSQLAEFANNFASKVAKVMRNTGLTSHQT
jgi:hypothetical protein